MGETSATCLVPGTSKFNNLLFRTENGTLVFYFSVDTEVVDDHQPENPFQTEWLDELTKYDLL